MPGLTGSVTDNAFALDEIFLTAVADLPFHGYFITEPVTLLINVNDVLAASEVVQILINPLTINVADTITIVEFRAVNIIDVVPQRVVRFTLTVTTGESRGLIVITGESRGLIVNQQNAFTLAP